MNTDAFQGDMTSSHATSLALDGALRLIHGDRPPAYLHC